jgi:hypothetical protein
MHDNAGAIQHINATTQSIPEDQYNTTEHNTQHNKIQDNTGTVQHIEITRQHIPKDQYNTTKNTKPCIAQYRNTQGTYNTQPAHAARVSKKVASSPNKLACFRPGCLDSGYAMSSILAHFQKKSAAFPAHFHQLLADFYPTRSNSSRLFQILADFYKF